MSFFSVYHPFAARTIRQKLPIPTTKILIGSNPCMASRHHLGNGTLIAKRLSGSKKVSFTYRPTDMINVLLVEDDIINQKVASRFLMKCGVDVTVANGGFEALQLIRKKHYNFVLMDIQMPDLDGCETTTRIRALDDPYYKTVPIIAFSASTTIEEREKAMLHGMNGFVMKPLNNDDLETKLNQYML